MDTEVKAYTEGQVKEYLKEAKLDWEIKEGGLEREFTFPDFTKAFSFMKQVAEYVEKENHHPGWSNIYNVVCIRLTTHDAEGITEKDLKMAHGIDALAGDHVGNT